ncbi:MAG: cytochrome o ubiquinol oxidase subunit IV [Candidatus Pacebacteria bacterium]|jgi:cytochrome o ubiquinol oxidase operon protein cyoD|nr:cytochrome o ubiquinol oxidase subunit IV [Candidatus Paceibacterota bacterium]
MTNDFKVIDEQHEGGKRAIVSYVIGFALSIILTLIPYFMVVNHMAVSKTLMFGVLLFALVQFLVQVIFFLHLSKKSRPYWNLIVFAYTILVVAILVIGSIWIMDNLNYNTMNMTPFDSNEGYIPSADR